MAGDLLTVVVGSLAARATIEHTVTSLRASAARSGVPFEIIVADGSLDGTADLARRAGADHVLTGEGDELVPDLWARGIRASSGRWVALATGHSLVPPQWAAALVGALQAGASAAGAGILPHGSASSLDRAIVYLRYASFLGYTEGPLRPAHELPGDNVAYPGDALRTWLGDRAGFWELEYHDVLRARGDRLVAVPAATVTIGRSYPWRVIARHRMRHGRRFGEERIANRTASPVRLVVGAPLVPAVLAARAVRHTMGRPGHVRAFVSSLAPFLSLAAAWAAGEARAGLEELFGGR